MKQQLTVRFFDGPPIENELEPGQIGINFPLFEKVLSDRPANNPNWERMVCQMFFKANEDGTLPRNDVVAEATGFHRDTAMRAKTRFEKMDLIYRSNFRGTYAYHPHMVIVRDRAGRVIRHPRVVREKVPLEGP